MNENSSLIISAYIGEEIEIDGPATVKFAGFTARGQGELLFRAPKSTRIKRIESKSVQYSETPIKRKRMVAGNWGNK